MLSQRLRLKRHGLRNQTIFVLLVKSGLRSKEFSQVSWKEICNSDDEVDQYINFTDRSSNGESERLIPLHEDARQD